jgi:hypothetical protein
MNFFWLTRPITLKKENNEDVDTIVNLQPYKTKNVNMAFIRAALK